MRIELPYGDTPATAELRCGRVPGVLDVAETPALPNPEAALRQALERPIGLNAPCLHGFGPGESTVILVSDAFRDTGVDQLLPELLAALNERGVRDRDITFLFATGSHRPPNEAEQRRILGLGVYGRFRGRTLPHDPQDTENLVELGATSRGTPVHINRRAVDAAHVIATGAVVLHYFGGFGGGRKSIVPGIAGMDTIAANHSLNLHPTENTLNPAVRIGTLDGNPVAEDMLEAARMLHVDCIVNTVLNQQGGIAGVFAGELDTAHRAAATFARTLFSAPLAERADLVLASAGTAKNFVQSHKALFNAFQAMRPGGRMVFAARAPEGYGGNRFAEWIGLGSRDRIIAELRKRAEINGQTALSAIEKAAHAVMLTELSAPEVAALGARKAETLQEAIDLACADLRETGVGEPGVYVMPSASYTVPEPAAG